MTSFREKLDEKVNSHAYCLGVDAFHSGLSMAASPYERGSKPDSEWVDGYLDAMYIKSI